MTPKQQAVHDMYQREIHWRIKWLDPMWYCFLWDRRKWGKCQAESGEHQPSSELQDACQKSHALVKKHGISLAEADEAVRSIQRAYKRIQGSSSSSPPS